MHGCFLYNENFIDSFMVVVYNYFVLFVKGKYVIGKLNTQTSQLKTASAS